MRTFEPTKENPNIGEWLCRIDKVINIVNYWFNQMEKLIAAVKVALFIWLR